MSHPYGSPTPEPWARSRRGSDAALARIARAAFEHRQQLATCYPWVPAAQFTIGGIGCPGPRCHTAGALVLLWERWSWYGGSCPRCGARGLGVTAGGGLSTGRVTGVCIGCEALLERWIPGFHAIMHGVGEALHGTSFRLTGVPVPAAGRGAAPLVAVLQELGASGLAQPRGRDGARARKPRRRRR
jgi:hypothetical protein